MRQTLLTNDQLLHLQREKEVLNEALGALSAFELPRMLWARWKKPRVS